MTQETKHTPAPWMVEKVKTSCGHCFKIGTKEQFQEKKDRPLNIPSYACLYVDYGNASNQSEANANLIAAAPELLEALECMAIAACAVAMPHAGERKLMQGAVDMAREAIKKAKGN